MITHPTPWKEHADNALGYPLLALSALVILFLLVYGNSMGESGIRKRNAWIRKWFSDRMPGRLVKEIVSREGELHFRRWRLFETDRLRMYVHRIYKADEDDHLHNHPWNFAVLCLGGSYTERVKPRVLAQTGMPYPMDRGMVFVRPWSFRRRTKEDFHKISRLHTDHVTTLVLAWGEKTDWGYDVDGTFVDFETYRFQKDFDRRAKSFEEVNAGVGELEEMARIMKLKTSKPEDVLKAIKALQEEIESNKEKLEKLKKEI